MFFTILFFLLFEATAIGQEYNMPVLDCGGEASALLMDNSVTYSNMVKDRPFLTAAANGQTDLAKKLAADGADINETDPANGFNALMASILTGDPDEWLLESGINLKYANKAGQNALHMSAKMGYSDFSLKLISKGLPVSGKDKMGNTPLLYAAAAHNPRAVIALLNKGAKTDERNDDNLTPLAAASLIGNTATVAVLLEAGADPNVLTPCGAPLHAALRQKNRLIFDKLLEYRASPEIADMNGDTPLHMSAAADDVVSARALLALKTNVDRKNALGKTPLFIAAEKNNEAMARLLLSKGADLFAADASGATPYSVASVSMPNLINEHLRRLDNETLMLFAAVTENNITRVNGLLNSGVNINSVDAETGNTPVFAAVANDYKEMLALLAKRGVNINHRNRLGNTPLMGAVVAGDDRLVEELLSFGSDPNLSNNSGETALLWAVKLNKEAVVQSLLTGKANPNIKSNTGVTPLKVSEGEGFDEITKLLRAFGAF
jgi:ankyrin repeat protein